MSVRDTVLKKMEKLQLYVNIFNLEEIIEVLRYVKTIKARKLIKNNNIGGVDKYVGKGRSKTEYIIQITRDISKKNYKNLN